MVALFWLLERYIDRSKRKWIEIDYKMAEEELREIREENREEIKASESFDVTKTIEGLLNLGSNDPEFDSRGMLVQLYKDVFKSPEFKDKSKILDYLEEKLGIENTMEKINDVFLNAFLKKVPQSNVNNLNSNKWNNF